MNAPFDPTASEWRAPDGRALTELTPEERLTLTQEMLRALPFPVMSSYKFIAEKHRMARAAAADD